MFSHWNIYVFDFEYQEPAWFFALVLIPILIIWIVKSEKKKGGDLKFNGPDQNLVELRNPWVQWLYWVMVMLPVAIVTLLIFAMARPFNWNSSDEKYEENKFGIDIVIALDVSLSMFAQDFKPNRLEAAKEVAGDFIKSRQGDKVGLVIYSGEAYTACPPTLDYSVLIEQLRQADGGALTSGTAVGTGLGTAVVQLRNTGIKSKVIILLTDGSNNSGDISPEDAALLAKQKNICVYTIGVGSKGMALSPVMTPMGLDYEYLPVEIDEETLRNIAKTTGGTYFRATDKEALGKIYSEIDLLEKRKIKHKIIQSEPPATPESFLNWALLLTSFFLVLKFILFLPNHRA